MALRWHIVSENHAALTTVSILYSNAAVSLLCIFHIYLFVSGLLQISHQLLLLNGWMMSMVVHVSIFVLGLSYSDINISLLWLSCLLWALMLWEMISQLPDQSAWIFVGWKLWPFMLQGVIGVMDISQMTSWESLLCLCCCKTVCLVLDILW